MKELLDRLEHLRELAELTHGEGDEGRYLGALRSVAETLIRECRAGLEYYKCLEEMAGRIESIRQDLLASLGDPVYRRMTAMLERDQPDRSALR